MGATRELQADTVDALVDTTRSLIDEEIGVGEALQSRASGLAGFAGVILSVAGAVLKIGDPRGCRKRRR